MADEAYSRRNRAALPHLAEIWECSRDGLVVVDWRGAILDCNPAYCEIVGYTREELLEMEDFYQITPERWREWEKKEIWAGRLMKGGYSGIYQKEYTRKDGRVIAVEIQSYASFYEGGVPRRCWAVCRDVTERKQMEEDLRRGEENFRTFFETVDDLLMVGAPDGSLWYANRATADKLGYPVGELTGKHILDLHPPEYRDQARAILDAMMRGEKDMCPLPLKTRDGRWLPVETRVFPGTWHGKDCIYGISKDLSAQRAALDKFQKLFEGNPAPMVVSGVPDGRLTDVNASFLRLFGYAREDVIGKTSDEIGLFVDEEKRGAAAATLRSSGSVRDVELQVRCKGGLVLDGVFSGVVLDNQGDASLLSVMVDVTDRNRMAAELGSLEQSMKLAVEGTDAGTWDWHVQTGAVTFNARWAEIVGHTLEDLAPISIQTWVDLCHPEDLELSETLLHEHFRRESPRYECEARMRHKEGWWVWVLDRGRVFEWDREGRPLRMAGTHVDITARREAEDSLRERETRYRTLAENLPDIVYRIHLAENWRMEFFNDRLEAITGYRADELVRGGRCSIEPFIHPEDVRDVLAQVGLAVRESGFFEVAYRFLHKSGETRSFSERGRVICGSDDRPLYIDGVIHDTTGRKVAEERLKASVKEKETLLKELQHRVKNSLNIVSSILGLAMGDLSCERDRRVFVDTQSRIYSMAGLYQQLYQSDSLDSIELSDYVSALTSSLSASYAPADGRVSVALGLEEAAVDLRRAAPLGLILTELFSNALKYAYPDGCAGEVRVGLHRAGSRITLSVSDDGRGLPDGVDLHSGKSLGLHLVEMLTAQVGGEFAIGPGPSGKGTVATVTIAARGDTAAVEPGAL